MVAQNPAPITIQDTIVAPQMEEGAEQEFLN
jgi:hypothetical protein